MKKGLGLRLEVSVDRIDPFSDMGDTYRDEGLSVGANHLRVLGEEITFINGVQYEDLKIGKRIGQGACSAVSIATHKYTKVKYAVKMFNIYDHRQAEQLKKEIFLLTNLDQCDALISFCGAFHNEGAVGMVLEYMDFGSLEFFLHIRQNIEEHVLAAIIYQILWGLGYLHYEHKLHRDIKPANVLFNSEGFVKLSDFGISKELGSSTSMSGTSVGTCRYMSPERLIGQPYDASGDIWSVGIMMLELWNKLYPFEDCCATPIDLLEELESDSLFKIIESSNMDYKMQKLIKSMLYRDHNQRANCSELLESKWFADCYVTDLEAAHRVVADWLDTNGDMMKSCSGTYDTSSMFIRTTDKHDIRTKDFEINENEEYHNNEYNNENEGENSYVDMGGRTAEYNNSNNNNDDYYGEENYWDEKADNDCDNDNRYNEENNNNNFYYRR